MVNLVELCKNLERKIAKLYQFSLLVNQISDIVELFNCGVRKKGNSMAFFYCYLSVYCAVGIGIS